MFKNFCLTCILVLSLVAECRASIWDTVATCFTNPCNCGFGNKIEHWHTGTIDRGPLNILCPPWNKEAGRDDHTCLANTPYPSIFTSWYLSHCAENTRENTFFSPKIRIRNQTCNGIACWTMSKTLNWDGECLIWPTPYALPLLRICARIAQPENPKTKTPADPGYTYGKHLDYEGFEEDDEVIIGVDGQQIDVDKPKLCAYRDPSILDFVSLGITLDGIAIPDLMDFNPMKQPFHKTQELHLVGKIILFFIKMIQQTGQGLIQMLGSLFDLIGNAIIPNLDFFKPLFDLLGAIIEKLFSVLEMELKKFLQINRLVSDYKFGCVEIPMAPYPPPFCPKILPFIPSATTQFICETASNGTTILNSVSSKPCVVSKSTNNFINNTVRVTFDNFVPLCKRSEDTNKTDKCVRLANIGLFNSAKALHAMTARRDAIKRCSSTTGKQPCVETKIPFSCSVSANGCEDGFRIVYATKIGNKSMPSGYFMDDLEDCGTGNTHISCQEIWGVNIGEFRDTNLTFPLIEVANNTRDLVKTLTLKDTNAMTRTFNASIVRQTVFDPISQFQREPNQICVSENNTIIGCVPRAEVTKPVVYSCESGLSGLPHCTTDYFVPKFIISMRGGAYSTSAIIQPLSVNNSATSSYTINLAGYDFTSFVTDETYIEKPFTGTKALNSTTLFGTYKNDAVPYNTNTKASTRATYLYGLEYGNDKYMQGGKYACAKFLKPERCPVNEKNCVLSNILSRNLVKCNDFFNMAKIYGNLRLCNASDTQCVVKDSVAKKSGGGTGITIYQCGGATGDYCYKNASNIEVCKISMSPVDRYMPEPDSDPNVIIQLEDSAYYPGGLQQDYDGNLYALRDKTSVELGLCAAVPQPICAAIQVPTAVDNRATWTEASVGTQSTGTCIEGTSQIDPDKPLKRYCISNVDNRTIKFEPLDPDTGCRFYSIKITEKISSFPPNYTYSIYSDELAGGVEFGKSSHINNLSQGIYFSNLSANINDLANVEFFEITTISFKDNSIITVNDQVVYQKSDSSSIVGPSVNATSLSNIDIKPYLVEGENDIRIIVGVSLLGQMYYKIDYKMK